LSRPPTRPKACMTDCALGPESIRTKTCHSCQNLTVFARKVRVEYEEGDQRHPCPLKWLDSFAMRNFTNDQVFDDTVPTGDGEMEIGARVPVERLQRSMEEWLRRKSYLPKEATLLIAEQP